MPFSNVLRQSVEKSIAAAAEAGLVMAVFQTPLQAHSLRFLVQISSTLGLTHMRRGLRCRSWRAIPVALQPRA